MCYAKPGPRCQGHAANALENISNSISKTISEKQRMSESLSRNNFDNEKQYDAAREKYAKLEEKLVTLYNKRKDAVEDYYQTKGGIQELAKEHKDAERKFGRSSAQEIRLRNKVDEAESGYDKRMREYDNKYQTVNGRKPSGYASQLGLQYLAEQKEEIRVKIRVGFAKGNDTSKLTKRLESLKEEEGFAKNTLRRIQTGKLKREYAPPSPRLQKTEEYKSYIQSAHAAPDVASTARELKAIGLRSDGSIAPHPTSPEYKKAKNTKNSQQEELNARLDRLDAQYKADQKAKEEKKKIIPPHIPLQDRPYAEQQRLKEKGVQPDMEGQEILF